MRRALLGKLALACVLLAAPSGVAAAGETDLGAVYPATLGRDEPDLARRETACGPEDVWDLSSFAYEVKGRVKIALGPCTAVVGHEGANALWAYVVPRAPGSLHHADGGDDGVTRVWLRFPPALVGEILPARTVVGRGDPKALYDARSVAWWKLGGWCREAVPPADARAWQTVEACTPDARSLLWCVGRKAKDTLYFPGPAAAAPVRAPVDPAVAVKAFDEAWAEFDRTYAKFALRDVDWDALKERYRPLAQSATTTWEAAGAVGLLLSHLRDPGVFLATGGGRVVPTEFRPRVLNANWKAAQALLAGPVTEEDRVAWGRTSDDLGYVRVPSVWAHEGTEAFDAAIEELGSTWGLVLDLRFAEGGDEATAAEFAGRIVDRERVYATTQVRAARGRTDLAPAVARRCAPRGPWRYEAPVVVLTGPRTRSAPESLALMLAACEHVTSVGDRTAGASGDVLHKELPGGIAVDVPQSLETAADGLPVDGVGARPEVPVVLPAEAFETRDPLLEQALARLRATPRAQRRAGRRVP